VSNNVEIKECYVGSTRNFRTRKSNHKSKCNNDKTKEYHFNVYQFIRANGGWDCFSMVMVEEFKHDTKLQLRSRERHHIETLKATLNKQIPSRSPAEYYSDNIEVIKVRKAEYHQNNREVLNAKMKIYHQNNREELARKQLTKHTCICGVQYTQSNKGRHLKSKKHTDFITTELN